MKIFPETKGLSIEGSNGQELKKLQRAACMSEKRVIKWEMKDRTRVVKLILTLASSRGTFNG